MQVVWFFFGIHLTLFYWVSLNFVLLQETNREKEKGPLFNIAWCIIIDTLYGVVIIKDAKQRGTNFVWLMNTLNKQAKWQQFKKE